jgi:hypothetical protein
MRAGPLPSFSFISDKIIVDKKTLPSSRLHKCVIHEAAGRILCARNIAVKRRNVAEFAVERAPRDIGC